MASEHGEGVASEVAERWDDDFEPKSAGKLLTAKDDAEADKQSVNLGDSDSSSSFGVPSENDDSDDGQEGHVGVDDESESISDDDDSLGSFSSSNDENDDFLRMWNPSAQGVFSDLFGGVETSETTATSNIGSKFTWHPLCPPPSLSRLLGLPPSSTSAAGTANGSDPAATAYASSKTAKRRMIGPLIDPEDVEEWLAYLKSSLGNATTTETNGPEWPDAAALHQTLHRSSSVSAAQVDSSVRSLELEWQGKCDAAAVVEGAKVIFLVLLRCRGRLEPSNQSNSQPSHAVEEADRSREAVFTAVVRVLWLVVQVGSSSAIDSLGTSGALEVEGLLEWAKQLADRQSDSDSPSSQGPSPPLFGAFDEASRYSVGCLRLDLYLALYSAMAHLTAARPALWTMGFPSRLSRHFYAVESNAEEELAHLSPLGASTLPQALALRRIAVTAASTALLHRLGRSPISGERLRPPIKRKHHRNRSTASSSDGVRDNGGRKSYRRRGSPRHGDSVDKYNTDQAEDGSLDSARGHRWAFAAGAGDQGLQTGSTRVLGSSYSSDGMESDSSGQYTTNSSDTLSDGRAYGRRSSIPFIATVAATAAAETGLENSPLTNSPVHKTTPGAHIRDDSACSDLTTGSPGSSENSSQLRAVSKAGSSHSVAQPVTGVIRSTKVASSGTAGSDNAASALLGSLRRAGVGDLESFLGRAGLTKHLAQFCEFGVSTVLDLLDDAISDNDLKKCIHLSQLDVNRFRLAGNRAREVLARDFGAPFDLRVYLSPDDKVPAASSFLENPSNTRAEGLSATKSSRQEAYPLAILPELPVRNTGLLPNLSDELRDISPSVTSQANIHRRVQSASPRVPVTRPKSVQPSANGAIFTPLDPGLSAEAGNGTSKSPLMQLHRRNSSSGTLRDRGTRNTSSSSSSGAESATGRRRRRAKGNQRSGSERSSRHGTSPGNSGSSGDEMLTSQQLWQTKKRNCSGRRLLAARAAGLPWGCPARSKALLALGLHFTSALDAPEIATPRDGQESHDPSSVTTNTGGSEDHTSSTKRTLNQVRPHQQRKYSRHDRLAAIKRRQRLEAGVSALFEAATCLSAALNAEAWRPALGAALGPYDGRLCTPYRAHIEPPPTLFASAIGFIALATLAKVLESNKRPLLAHRMLTLCAAAAPIPATLQSSQLPVPDPVLIPNHIVSSRDGHYSTFLWYIRRRHLAKRAVLEGRLGAAHLGQPSLYSFLADLNQRKSAATLAHVALRAASALALSSQPSDALDVLRRTECALVNRVSKSAIRESHKNARSSGIPQSLESAAVMPISSPDPLGVALQAGREYEVQIPPSKDPTNASRSQKTHGADCEATRGTNSLPSHTTGGAPPDGRGLEMLDTTPRTTQRSTLPEIRRKVPETFMLDIFLDGFLGLNSFDEGNSESNLSPQIRSTEKVTASDRLDGSTISGRINSSTSMPWTEDRMASDWIIGCAGVAYAKVDKRFISSNISGDDDTDSESEGGCLLEEPATALWLQIQRIRYELVTACVACGRSSHAVSLLESMLSQASFATSAQSPKSSARNTGCWPHRRTTRQRRSLAKPFSIAVGKIKSPTFSSSTSHSFSGTLPRIRVANRRALLSWLARAKLDSGNSRGARAILAELRAIDAADGGTSITNSSCSGSGFFGTSWGVEGGYGAAAFGDCGEIEAKAWWAEGHIAAALDSVSKTIASVEDTLHGGGLYLHNSKSSTYFAATLLEELAKLCVLRGRIALEGAQSLPPNAFPLILADASKRSRHHIAKPSTVKSTKTKAVQAASNRTKSKLLRQTLIRQPSTTATDGFHREEPVKKPSAASATENATVLDNISSQEIGVADGIPEPAQNKKRSSQPRKERRKLPDEQSQRSCGHTTVLISPSELLHDAACSLRRAGAAAAAAGEQSGGNRGGAVSAEAAVLLASVAVAAAFEPVMLYRVLQNPCDSILAHTPLDFGTSNTSSTTTGSEIGEAVESDARGAVPPGVPPLNISPPPPPLSRDTAIWTLAETQRAATYGLAGAHALGEPLLHFEALVVDAEVTFLHAATVAAGCDGNNSQNSLRSEAAFVEAMLKWCSAHSKFKSSFAASSVTSGSPDVPLARSSWVLPHTLSRLVVAAERLLRCLIAASQDPRSISPPVLASIDRALASGGHQSSTRGTFVDGRGFLQANLELFEHVQALQRDIARRNCCQSSFTSRGPSTSQSTPDTLHDDQQPRTRRFPAWCLPRRGVQENAASSKPISTETMEAASKVQVQENNCLPPLVSMRGSQEDFSLMVQEDEVCSNSYGFALLAATLGAFAPNLTLTERRQCAEAATSRLHTLKEKHDEDHDGNRYKCIDSSHKESVLRVVIAVGLGPTMVAWAPCGQLHVLGTGLVPSRLVFQGTISDAKDASKPEWASQSFAKFSDGERKTILNELISQTNFPSRSRSTSKNNIGGLQAFADFLESISQFKCPFARTQHLLPANGTSAGILLVGLHPLIGLPLILLASTSISILRAHSLAVAIESFRINEVKSLMNRRDTMVRIQTSNENDHQIVRAGSKSFDSLDMAACATVLGAVFPNCFAWKNEIISTLQNHQGLDNVNKRDQGYSETSFDSVVFSGNLSPRTMSRTPRGGWRIAAAPDLHHGPPSGNECSDIFSHLNVNSVSSLPLSLPIDKSPISPSGFSCAELPDIAEANRVNLGGPYTVIRQPSPRCILLAPLADLVHLPDTLSAYLSATKDLTNDIDSAPAVVVFCSAHAETSFKAAIASKEASSLSLLDVAQIASQISNQDHTTEPALVYVA